jgi:hypothetical protein
MAESAASRGWNFVSGWFVAGGDASLSEGMDTWTALRFVLESRMPGGGGWAYLTF